jgi:hypothetical protein
MRTRVWKTEAGGQRARSVSQSGDLPLLSPGAPRLSIFRISTNTVAVSWPSPSTGWNLQQNTNNVSCVNWSNITSGIVDDGTNKTLIVNPPTSNRFYRPQKP